MEEPQAVRTVLESARTVAVIGVSDKPDRDSHRVASYLQHVGYRVVPVNPNLDEVLGERCYPNLASIPADIMVDIADVFRRPEFVPETVDAAIARGVPVLWLQLGVNHDEAERLAAVAGMVVISGRCIMIEHRRLFGG